MTTVEAQIATEKKAFNAALEQMLPKQKGEFVVFKDGEAQGYFADARAAYSYAIDAFGLETGFLIRQVAPARLEVPSLTWHFGLTHVL